MGGEVQAQNQMPTNNAGIKVLDTILALHTQEGKLDTEEKKTYEDITKLARDRDAFSKSLNTYFDQKFGVPPSPDHAQKRMEFTQKINDQVQVVQFHSEMEQEVFLYKIQRQLSSLRSNMEVGMGFSTGTDTQTPSKVKGLNTDVFKKGKNGDAMLRDYATTEALNKLARAGIDTSTFKVKPITDNIVQVNPQTPKDNTPVMRALTDPSILAEFAAGIWLGVAGFASGKGGAGLDIASAVLLHWALDDARQDRGLRDSDIKRITDGIVGKKEKHLSPDKAKQLEGIVSSYAKHLSTGMPNAFIRTFFTVPPGDGLRDFKSEMVNMNKELFESIQSAHLELALDAANRQKGQYPLGNNTDITTKKQWLDAFFLANNQNSATFGTFWAKFQKGGIYSSLIENNSQYKNTVLDDIYQVILGLNSAGVHNALRKDIFRDVVDATHLRSGSMGIKI